MNYYDIILEFGGDILSSEGMQKEKTYLQHGDISCYEHSLLVARKSVSIASALHMNVDMKSLVRGALLHDYFLYDWHIPDQTHRLHGFIHAGRALENAEKDFSLNDKERDIIRRHMFPLNIKPPKYKESAIVCIADKLSAFGETVSGKITGMPRIRRGAYRH